MEAGGNYKWMKRMCGFRGGATGHTGLFSAHGAINISARGNAPGLQAQRY